MFNLWRRRGLGHSRPARGRISPTPRRGPEALAVGREFVRPDGFAAAQAQFFLDGSRVDDHIARRLRRCVHHDLHARMDVAAAPQERNHITITNNSPSFRDELREGARPDGVAHARGAKRDAVGAPALRRTERAAREVRARELRQRAA